MASEDKDKDQDTAAKPLLSFEQVLQAGPIGVLVGVIATLVYVILAPRFSFPATWEAYGIVFTSAAIMAGAVRSHWPSGSQRLEREIEAAAAEEQSPEALVQRLWSLSERFDRPMRPLLSRALEHRARRVRDAAEIEQLSAQAGLAAAQRLQILATISTTDETLGHALAIERELAFADAQRRRASVTSEIAPSQITKHHLRQRALELFASSGQELNDVRRAQIERFDWTEESLELLRKELEAQKK